MNDYLEHYNHNHDALGRFARSAGSASSSIGRKLSGKKDKNNTTRKYESSKRLASKKTKASNAEVAKKKKGSKSNNTKLSDEEKKRLVESGTLKEITKNKDRLSNRELEKAIDRLQKEKVSRVDLEKKLSDLSNPVDKKKKMTGMERVADIGKKMNTTAEALNSGIKLYNNIALIYNRGKNDSDKLPMIGGKNNKEKDKIPPRDWVQNIINTGNAKEANKYADRMTPEERSEVVKALSQIESIRKYSDSGKSNDSKKEEKKKKGNKK